MDSSSRNQLHSSLLMDATFVSLTSNTDRVSHILEHQLPLAVLRAQVEANLLAARQNAAKCLTKANGYAEEAQLHLAAGDRTEALVALRKALLYTPVEHQLQKVDHFFRMAEVHFDMANYEAAAWAVNQAMLLQSRTCHTSNVSMISQVVLRAKCSQKRGRIDEAIETIEGLISMAQNYGISKDQLEQASIRAFLAQLKREKEAPSYATEFAQWRLQQDEAAMTLLSNRRAISGSTYHRFDPARIVIRDSPKFGRHFVATSTIPDGATILEERPISVSLQPSVLGIKCFACHHDLVYRFYPCEQCTLAVYCDKECATQDWAGSHRGSCRGMLTVMQSIGSFPLHLFQMVTRVGGPKAAVAIQADAASGYSIDQYLEDHRRNQEAQERDISDYKMANILACHEGKQGPEATVNHTVTAMETAMALLIAHDFEGLEEPDCDFFIQFAAMLVTDLRRIIYNVFGWTEWSTELYVGNCQVLVGSLVNHSCVANAKWEWSNGVISFKAKRQIDAGEEITISYGPNESQSYYKRQSRLNSYNFACTCAACLKAAISGSALKCATCQVGPVVFESALNLNPLLHGRCLTCLAPYDQLTRYIRQLRATKATTSLLATLTAVLPSSLKNNNQAMLLATLNSLTTLHKLALADGAQTLATAMSVATILKQSPNGLAILNLEGRLNVLHLLDQCLPTVLPAKALNGQVLGSLAFWFKTAINWAKELSLHSKTSSCSFEARDILHLVLAFSRRYQQALATIADGIRDDPLVSKVITRKMEQLGQALDQFQVTF